MQNNPEAGIRTDFAIDGIVKPKNMNALAASIQYDYVVTSEMIDAAIDAGADEIDVDVLLGGNKIKNRAGEYHVLINAPIENAPPLKFDAGSATGDLHIHIYAHGRFSANVTGSSASVTFYFHTSGKNGAVTLKGIGYNTYVGSFDMEAGVTAPAGATFVYETALGELPHSDEMELRRDSWMSNGVGSGNVQGGSHAIITLLDYLRIGAPNGTPRDTWPIYMQWKAQSGVGGVLTATAVPPIGTAPGVSINGCLVYREKEKYQGYMLPPIGLFQSPPLVFRMRSGDWSGNFELAAPFPGFVLSDSFLGCTPVESESGTAIKINENTTQVDVYATLGLVLGDTDKLLPPYEGPAVWAFHVDDMAEGQVIEMNFHIVNLPPAKQNLSSDLGLEHFIGDWDAHEDYGGNALVAVTKKTAGVTTYYFYRSLTANNNGNDPETSPTYWEPVGGGPSDDTGVLHAATPLNSRVRAHLLFKEGGTTLATRSWGYGTGPQIGSNTPCSKTTNEVNITFSEPKNVGYTDVSDATPPSIPVAASAKVIFTKINIDNVPTIIILTGGYCSPAYPNY